MLAKLITIALSVQFIQSVSVNRCRDGNRIDKRETLIELNETASEEFFFQGDIVLTSAQEETLRRNSLLRTGTRNLARRWPKNGNGLVIIPYTIRSDAGYTERGFEIIRDALESIGSSSCIRFVPRAHEDDYLEFFSGGGCFAPLGRTGGRQSVSIRRDQCLEKGKVIHEVFHALGFTHMHNRVDRDDYIRVFPEHLMYANWLRHFDKIDSSAFNDFGTPYDLASVMHYPKYAFARAGQSSILPCDPAFDKVIGYAKEMSQGDIKRLNMMYECWRKP